MPKVALVQVVFNSKRFMSRVIPAALNQTEKDIEFYAVISGNDDAGREHLEEFHPEVKILDPGTNVGFAKGHNLIFNEIDAPYFQLINPDLIISPDFVEKMLECLETNSRVGAIGGKLLTYDFINKQSTNIIDSTGVIIRKTGRALDRGQHCPDQQQYDEQTDLMAVSGAGPMYRRDALTDVAETSADGHVQYFDEDFHSYFEDVDLCWRMYNRGWKIRYQPKAIGWHGRAVASSRGGYGRVLSFIKHRREIPLKIRRLNYKNHFFLFLKNSPRWYAQFISRELFYNVYILFIETSVLRVLPEMLKQLPSMLAKRKILRQRRNVSMSEAEKLLD